MTNSGDHLGGQRRVVHVITGLQTGGAEAMLVRVAQGLQARGFEQHIVTLTGSGAQADALNRSGLPVTCIDLRRPARWLPDLWRVVKLVRKIQPHAIQGWMYHGDLLAALLHRLAPGKSTRRLFWGVRASNMDDARYAHLIACCARLSRWPDVIVANSDAGLAFHLARGYRPRRSIVIANGVHTEKFKPDAELRTRMRAECGFAHEVCVAIHVARVDAMKDHTTAIEALARVPEMKAIFVGEGTNSLKVGSRISTLGLRHDLERLYPVADIVLSSSAFGEGFSNALAEGMSCGLVPIATEVGDVRSIVGDTGAVVPPRDVECLAAALREEAGRSASERHDRGLRARARVVRQFTVERAVDKFQLLYTW